MLQESRLKKVTKSAMCFFESLDDNNSDIVRTISDTG